MNHTQLFRDKKGENFQKVNFVLACPRKREICYLFSQGPGKMTHLSSLGGNER